MPILSRKNFRRVSFSFSSGKLPRENLFYSNSVRFFYTLLKKRHEIIIRSFFVPIFVNFSHKNATRAITLRFFDTFFSFSLRNLSTENLFLSFSRIIFSYVLRTFNHFREMPKIAKQTHR